jgi:hypothetical protein
VPGIEPTWRGAISPIIKFPRRRAIDTGIRENRRAVGTADGQLELPAHSGARPTAGDAA